jgi:hypothetical protein
MAETTEDDTATKPAKQKLTPDERRDRVRQARLDRVNAAFVGKSFEFVEEFTLEGAERYTDVTGNKGKNGFRIRNTETDEVLTVGQSSLKKAAEMGVISLPDGVFSKRAKAETNGDAEDTPAETSEESVDDLLS